MTLPLGAVSFSPAAGAELPEVPICICDAHGDVLFYWGNTHEGQPRTVFHLDSHADMMVNWSNQIWTTAGPDWEPPSKDALVHRVASQVDLANFQPSAIFQGFVDAIVWLRSDFPFGQYNGPPPGHYKRALAMPDYGVEGSEPDPIIGDGARPLLAFFHVEGESFADYGPTLVHEARKEVAGLRRPGVPLERNTLWDDSWACTRPPVEHLSAPFDHSVVTLDQLLAPDGGVLDEVQSILRIGTGPRPSEWILDIDLDYFATYCPLMAYLIRKYDWLEQPDAEAFVSWAIPLGQLCSQGLEQSTRETLFAPQFQPHTVREVVRLPFTSDGQHAQPSAENILATFRAIHANCEIPVGVLRGLSSLVSRLTPQQRSQWATLQADDWWWVMQHQGPHHYSTPAEISASVRRLEPVMRHFPRAPSLVTIARSMDMYMPEGASDIAEWEVLLLVRRLWPQAGGHPLPDRLDECREEDVESLMSNVTLYATTRPLPGQEPEPMRPRPWPLAAPQPGRALGYSSSEARRAWSAKDCLEVLEFEVID